MNYLQAIEEDQQRTQNLYKEVKRLLHLLDQRELSDSGKEFSPVTISCCRVELGEELTDCITKLRKLSGYGSYTND